MVTTTDSGGPVRSSRNGRGAADPVLMSKITAPGQPAWAIGRPRIDELLGQGTRGPLTVVTGPPGAGKTMAIASWAAAYAGPGPLAWVSLDEYDNRPPVFWSYVVTALRRAGTEVPPAWTAAGRRKAVGHEFLLRLASALASAEQPVVMVIEDFHFLTDTDIIDGLSYLLRNAAPGLHLVISSRTQIPLSLHRYRLNGELVEIRAADLALSITETSSLMTQHGITLPAEALESLIVCTEGWAAGIRLAAMSLDGHPDPEQFVKQLCSEDSAITGYLVEEVLNPQPASLRNFLLRTSILNRVCANIAGELVGDEIQATSLLSVLAETNAFVQPLGDGWYRYHPLLAEILRLKLRHESPGQVPDLHRLAGGWYLRNGYLMEAVRHAADAGDWTLAASMVLEDFAINCLIELRDNESINLASIFHRVPEDLARNQEPAGNQLPLLLVAAALEHSACADDTGAVSLARAEAMIGHLPPGDEIPARLAAALIRLAVARRAGDLKAAIAASARAEEALGAIPEGVLALHPGLRPQVLLGRGMVEFWAGQADQAAATLRARHRRGVGARQFARKGRLPRSAFPRGSAARTPEQRRDASR